MNAFERLPSFLFFNNDQTKRNEPKHTNTTKTGIYYQICNRYFANRHNGCSKKKHTHNQIRSGLQDVCAVIFISLTRVAKQPMVRNKSSTTCSDTSPSWTVEAHLEVAPHRHAIMSGWIYVEKLVGQSAHQGYNLATRSSVRQPRRACA